MSRSAVIAPTLISWLEMWAVGRSLLFGMTFGDGDLAVIHTLRISGLVDQPLFGGGDGVSAFEGFVLCGDQHICARHDG